MTFNKNQAGLTLGTLFGLMHLLWVVVVGLGMGQSLANYWHAKHFLTDGHVLGQFQLGMAVVGVILAWISGYAVGWVFAALWNWFGARVR
ncbi:hypothetical protein A3B21_03760 [Candidatus Uhrbacteria bacterium RIFCSPLOWO2_01_FULL_47_24]|uniref:Uncharacterized protein n=1 Tax=Candidatus Uhrbacteria bacterium RIFCSPLOWO2_01_FULL_47_24 TaxID=1802401 RepID=A0A1F7URI9_9BACT|nr:MAG: hypothetical protein A2753_01485 [Candidatus Uhrbacteria bacterium RIFCSPHIGHO2_01_FULL_47_11]OGL68547.1 MAG: hypothetical protein A3D58_02360 [Candidatus Uhrbacteria bacterium RIFCSPHIGHO2_02_FULL_46_47]OGL75484.1 MAG: hypothetical protein A3F52_04235 [Candidatus Uhrbacteria bacterium RIFCSPHIGHO2_12_FULL_47_11]OGL80855.1 MAG: hypothetical protein A3B21_03760 [Candidatus Uhrbacteria bacterium RIFCSPLOWO2_01_FULL_47_24]OGL84753.1 MAG: hypothetical protein A3J03_01115 [Candidatus Uhrbact